MPILIACLECDLLHRETDLPIGGEARCVRCGGVLYRRKRGDANELALALTVTAAVLFLIANAFPIVTLEVQGVRNASTLLGAVASLWEEERQLVAALVFVTTVLVPAAELLGLTYVLLVLRGGRARRGLAGLLHLLKAVEPWGMVEVFFLGVLVSLVKLAHVAAVAPGVALFAFGALMLALVAATAFFDDEAAWARVRVLT